MKTRRGSSIGATTVALLFGATILAGAMSGWWLPFVLLSTAAAAVAAAEK